MLVARWFEPSARITGSQVGFPPRALKSFQFFLHNHLNQSSPRERVRVHFTFPALCSDWPKVTQADFTPITSLRKINEIAISHSMCQNVSMTTDIYFWFLFFIVHKGQNFVSKLETKVLCVWSLLHDQIINSYSKHESKATQFSLSLREPLYNS